MSEILPHRLEFNHVRIKYSPEMDDYSLVMGSKAENGSMDFISLGSVVRNVVQPGMVMPPSSIAAISYEGMQKLMDALWDAGVRPSEDTDEIKKATPAHAEAMQAHIEDLREITWHLLDKKKMTKQLNLSDTGLPDFA